MGKRVEQSYMLQSTESGGDMHAIPSFQNKDYPVDTQYLQMSLLSMFVVRWHWHDSLEIVVVTSGEAWVKTEEKSVLLHEGQGIFVNQNILHSIRSSDSSDCTLYSLRFHPSLIFGHDGGFLSDKYLNPVTKSPHLKYLELYSDEGFREELLTLADRAIQTNLKKPFGYELEVKSLLCHIWGLLLSNTDQQEESPEEVTIPHIDSGRIKAAMRYIEANHALPLSLDEIADSIHLSKSECCRCFKRTIGLTPFEYLLRFRIFEAARKIQQKETEADTISELAASVGFNSPSYFNKIFKKYLLCTPLEYKRRSANVDSSSETSFLPLSEAPDELAQDKSSDKTGQISPDTPDPDYSE